MPHQRFVPSGNPKTVLTEIFSQISDLRYSLLEESRETRFMREFPSAVSKGIVGNFIKPLMSRDA